MSTRLTAASSSSELQVGVLQDAVVDLEADRLAGELGGMLLGRGKLALGRLLGVRGEPVRRHAKLFDPGPLGQQPGAGLFAVHGRGSSPCLLRAVSPGRDAPAMRSQS